MSELQIAGLDIGHDVSDFSSGESSLDRWLHRYALANQRVGSSRTFVLLESGSPRVWGYYSLTVASFERDQVAPPALAGLPSAYEVPAVLLARLARDEKRAGAGYGPVLLADAVLRTLNMAENAGIRLLAVHALNERAREWYLAHDFQPSPVDERLLMLTVQDLQASRDFAF